MHQHLRSFVVALATAALFFASAVSALGGTTGSVSGRVRDSVSEAPLAGAKVTAASASQTAVDTTNAAGGFAFVSLVPDTYTMTVEHSGYNTLVVRGITVLADQTQTLTFALVKTLVTLGRVEVRAAGGLVKPGTTSDVYSINASASERINALGGPGNLNQAYSAMVSVPGVNLPQAQQGWYQTVYIRGGDQDQVGWEFDGIPVNRSYDNAPMTFLSNLGEQELQVYTGGTPATSDASSISGYVNQVVKRGSYPGYADVTLGIGGPAMYNKGLIEFGGATPDNRLSYYIGTLAVNSNYRYINQQNGVGTPGFFYPLALNFNGQSASGIWSGPAANCSTPTASCFVASPGQSYAIAQTRDRETIGNFTLNLPHGNNPSLSDNLQFLYLTAEIWTFYNSSVNDQGGPRYVYDNTNCLSGPAPCPGTGSAIPWQDGWIYSGPVFQQVQLPNVTYYAFPSSPLHGSGLGMPCYPECASIGTNVRDVNDNGVSIEKLQYQRNISNSSYLRIFGFGVYSNWYINGPLSAFLPFGAEIGDYENLMSNYGGSVSYANQLSDKHLITAGLFYSSGHSQRYTTTGGFPPCSADCSTNGGQASYITN
ncbi:MAG TPA: TonB-dependent receptor, partial [Vicinamibacterales bacterium]